MTCLEIRSSKVQLRCDPEIPTVASTEYLLGQPYPIMVRALLESSYYTDICLLGTTLGVSEGDADEYSTYSVSLIFFFLNFRAVK